MHLITPQQPHPLFNTAATRRLEQQAAAALPPHTKLFLSENAIKYDWNSGEASVNRRKKLKATA